MKNIRKYLIGLMLVVVAFSSTSCFKHVEPRQVGIKVKTMGDNKGIQPVTLEVGRYWIGPYWDLYTYPQILQYILLQLVPQKDLKLTSLTSIPLHLLGNLRPCS